MKKLLLIIFNIAFSFFFLPQIYAQSDQTVTNGSSTTAVNFTGGCTYNWTNNNPSIGLAANGTGNIPSFTAINTGITPITATIVATPASNGFAYVTNAGDGTLSVINIVTNKVVKTIPTGYEPLYVAISPDGSRVYVEDNGGGLVSDVVAIDAASNTIISRIQIVDEPSWGLAVSPDGSKLYIGCTNGSVTVVNTSNFSEVSTIKFNDAVEGIVLSPDGNRLYVTNVYGNNIAVVNTENNSISANIQLPADSGPDHVLLSPDGSLLYVADDISHDITIINTATNKITAKIPIGPGAIYGLSVSPDGSKIYAANTDHNIVTVISGVTNKIITTIPVKTPYGVSVSPDGNFLYAVNESSSSVSVINTTSYATIATIPVGFYPGTLGNFISSGIGCQTVTFKITVNPNPIITKSVATGTINACQGTPSANPNIQQFTVSGKYLAADITVTAPAGFETSLNATSGYNTSLTLTENNGTVNNTVVYVRSSATAPAGNIAGDVVLSSTGVAGQSVPVSGTVNMVPTVNPINPQTAPNGGATIPVNFTGTASAFSWTNDTPGIGLNASGTGNIPSFIATNNTNSPIIANIKVTPLNNTNCDGIPAMFTITVYPPPAVIVASEASGSVTACMGTPSASPNIQQFTVSGKYLPKDVKVTAPTGFELSLSSAGVYGNDLILTQNIGTVNNTIIYVRSSATAPAGNITGNIVITSDGVTDRSVPVNGIINTVPVVDEVPSQKLQNGATTVPVNFTGTANTYNWVNDNVNIGLAASGTGNIPSFTVINITNRPIIAAITVTPLNSTNCDGNPVRFTITAEPTATGLLTIPNTFTPNGDGRNDSWVIENFEYYPRSTISIFNRWGQKLFSSIGYPIPWDGTYQGKALPSGTYYYIIDLKNREPVITGWVAIIR